MRVSHAELNRCEASPESWVRNRLKSTDAFQMGMTYDRALRLSIHKFHVTKDSKIALNYLDAVITRHQKRGRLQNMTRVNLITRSLTDYIAWYNRSKIVLISSDFILRDTTKRFLTLGGKIARLDLTSGGYRAVLFGATPIGWKKELRFPLMQGLIATMFMRPANEISVGFQMLDGSGLAITSYSAKEIQKAVEQFEALGMKMKRYTSELTA